MTREIIIEKLMKILTEKLGIDSEIIKHGDFNYPLTGAYWRLSSNDMVYLYFFIEKDFSILIRPEHLENYEFNTLNGIIRLISDRSI